jgi:hypothetical protein
MEFQNPARGPMERSRLQGLSMIYGNPGVVRRNN